MRFKRVYVEITNRCNLSCPFCSPVGRPQRQMGEEEFLRIADQVRPFTEHLYFHVKGEPLLHPLLPRFLDICAEKGLRVNLTTNGTLIPRTGPMLLEKTALRQVNFSLHSFAGPDGAAQNRYLEEILSFAQEASRRNHAFIVLRLWNLDDDRKVHGAGIRMLETIRERFCPGISLTDLSHQRSVTLEKGIFLSFEKEFVWPDLKNDYISDKGTCYGARTMAAVLADGTVVPCCLDSDGVMALGNVFEENFADIIAKPNFVHMAESFTNRKVTAALCQRCGYRTRFDL